jgi:seryl-tRNA synthetase
MVLNYAISFAEDEDLLFFQEMLPYVSEYITEYKLQKDHLIIDYSDEKQKEQIISKLDILKELTNQKVIQDAAKARTKVFLDRTAVKCRNDAPVFDTLVKTGSLYECGEGIFGYGGVFLKILHYFLDKTREMGLIQFGAREYEFPVLFPVDSFNQGGYFETFPHHIMFQTTLKNDIDVLNQFSKTGWGDGSTILKNINTPANVLKNAACGPIYPMLAKEDIGPEIQVYFTWSRCFRNEAANIFELARLNEFSMSEVVFIGKDDQIKEGMERAKELWHYWIDLFNLNCLIESANDSFFAGNYKKLKFFQKIGDSKIEFKLLLPHCGKYIACASANYHRTHFSKKYDIHSGDGYCHTACIAFGLERLAYAFLCQHGCEPERWEQRIQDEINRYTGGKSQRGCLNA